MFLSAHKWALRFSCRSKLWIFAPNAASTCRVSGLCRKTRLYQHSQPRSGHICRTILPW